MKLNNIIDDEEDINFLTFEGVRNFKSARRAIKRGRMSKTGIVYPKRPFSNSKLKEGTINAKKHEVYEQYIGTRRTHQGDV